MEIKIVKKPIQDYNTKSEDLEYVEYITNENQLKNIIPNWCVKTFTYSENDGGMNLWFKELERINPDVIYLYEIKTLKETDDIIYSVRADLKKHSI